MSRMKIMVEEGLAKFEDHPEKIISFAQMEYMKTDATFRNKMQEIVPQIGVITQQIFSQTEGVDSLIERLGSKN